MEDTNCKAIPVYPTNNESLVEKKIEQTPDRRRESLLINMGLNLSQKNLHTTVVSQKLGGDEFIAEKIRLMRRKSLE